MGAVACLLGGAGAGVILHLRCRDGGAAHNYLLRATVRPAYMCGRSAPELQNRQLGSICLQVGGWDSRQICRRRQRRRAVAGRGCGQAGAFFSPPFQLDPPCAHSHHEAEPQHKQHSAQHQVGHGGALAALRGCLNDRHCYRSSCERGQGAPPPGRKEPHLGRLLGCFAGLPAEIPANSRLEKWRGRSGPQAHDCRRSS